MSTDATSSSSSNGGGGGDGLGGGGIASLKVMSAQVIAETSSHGVATSSTAGALGFPHIDSKQPETIDQTLRRKQPTGRIMLKLSFGVDGDFSVI